MTEDSDTKTGKNGKKEGLSGSSFFTWFMVIALLGVWTSVAVVWFDLVDYEEVLGKLGIYDADGDGDFDVDDAKVLLGQDPGGVAKPRSKAEVRESIKAHIQKVKEKLVLKRPKPLEQRKSKKDKESADKREKQAVVEKHMKEPAKGKAEKEKAKPGPDGSARHKETARSTSRREARKERASRVLAKLSQNVVKDNDKKKGK